MAAALCCIITVNLSQTETSSHSSDTTVLGLLGTTGTVVVAQDTHIMDHSSMNMSTEAMKSAVHAKAVVNSIEGGMVNVSHDPIPEIGWPAMTMDLSVLPNVKIMDTVKSDDTVTMMLVKGKDGMYGIQALMPE
jgi:Cu(I)/Ag(I) efflux system protein CusF